MYWVYIIGIYITPFNIEKNYKAHRYIFWLLLTMAMHGLQVGNFILFNVVITIGYIYVYNNNRIVYIQ